MNKIYSSKYELYTSLRLSDIINLSMTKEEEINDLYNVFKKFELFNVTELIEREFENLKPNNRILDEFNESEVDFIANDINEEYEIANGISNMLEYKKVVNFLEEFKDKI